MGKNKIKEIIAHNNNYINVSDDGHIVLSTDKLTEIDEFGYINSNLSVMANAEAELTYNTMPTDDFLSFTKSNIKSDGIEIEYFLSSHSIKLSENIELTKDCNVIRQTNTVVNSGEKPVIISKLSSTNVTHIGANGNKKWFENDRFLVSYCVNRWQGEGQWYTKTLDELGIYPCSGHIWEVSSFKISSDSSWSTAAYYPLIFIQDLERNECWFFEFENAASWFIEISAYHGFGSKWINVSVSGADEKQNWFYNLQPGENYTTSPAIYGLVKGGIEEAVRELVKYRRKSSLSAFKTIPLVFNDFMNCSWAMPSDKNLIPLIDAASAVGAEYFCIDAGWSENGVWIPHDELFGSYKFEGIIKYIISKGMKPGIWFEFETTTLEMASKFKNEKWILERYNVPLAHHRPLLNFRCEAARKFVAERIAFVYNLGVRYIKNDYNYHTQIGSTLYGESPAEGTLQNSLAFYAFIDEIKAQYSDLIIENCDAGAMRADNGTLKHFDLQSTSDQENYTRYPSILIGEMAFISPERAGIWSYPYPRLYKNREQTKVDDAFVKEMSDGEQTVFTMINGMMGVMYLSGHIDNCDKKNMSLIKEGVAVYKTYRDWIRKAYPTFVMPFKRMSDRTNNAFGLIDESGKQMILAVWNIQSKNNKVEIDLSKYNMNTVEKLYPSDFGKVEYIYDNKKLIVKFKKQNCARLFKLSI